MCPRIADSIMLPHAMIKVLKMNRVWPLTESVMYKHITTHIPSISITDKRQIHEASFDKA